MITLSKDTSTDEIIDTVGQYGLAIFPEFVSKSDLRALGEESTRSLSPSPDYGRVHVQSKEVLVSCLEREKLPADKYSVMTSLFGSDWMLEIANRFYQDYRRKPDNTFNNHIFVNVNRGVAQPIQKMPFLPHFDQLQTLKFFLYLDDTYVEDGAMSAEPASHKKTARPERTS